MKASRSWYRIPGVRGCNCYLWIGRQVVLIDTGLPGNHRMILEFIEKVAPGRTLHAIVLTHSDIDHIGSALQLRQATGARVAIHADDALAIEGKRALKEMHPVLSWTVQLFSWLAGYRPFEPDIILHDGDRIGGLQVVHVSGHSRGSIAVYKPGEMIFTGDAVMTTRTGALRWVRSFLTQSVERTRASTHKIAKLDFKILCPGHGPVVLQEASKKVRQQLEALTGVE